jgi:UrcA family protein
MKRLFLAATVILAPALAAPAFAEPTVQVQVPANVRTEAGQKAYLDNLDRAVNRVCHRAVGPVVGVSWYTFRDCIIATKAEVAAREPTGLYASRLGLERPATLTAQR